ncbi:MAG: 16S rRNA (cytosine(967)-C(5))-methyltransferase RsmB [Terriglobales bacterium]
MAVSAARAAAFEILLRVERDQSYAAELLHSLRYATLSHLDHGLTTELVMGVLRWRAWLDRHLAGASSQKIERLDEEVLTALRLGIYQLTFLSRVPARAAIFECVELVKKARKRSAATFVNAVLRKLSGGKNEDAESTRPADPFAEIAHSSDALALGRNSAHPAWLVARWVECYGLVTARKICAYDQHPPPASIRLYDEQSLEELAAGGLELGPGRLLSSARTILSCDVPQSRAYREGRIAIQDEGSQLVALQVGRGEKLLDCCAAPGGKTTLLARRNPAAMIVACDLHPHRARLLRERCGLPNVRIVAADARQFPFSSRFDRILADVPCSGTGTLARNPEIKWRLKREDLSNLQTRQVAILKSAIAQLTTGGRLVYSTCSLEPEENEAVVEAALDQSPEVSIIDCKEELRRLQQAGELCVDSIETLISGSYLRTIPGVHSCDGFFAALIKRKE